MSAEASNSIDVITRTPSRLAAIANSDLVYSFFHSRITIVAAMFFWGAREDGRDQRRTDARLARSPRNRHRDSP